MISIEDLSPTEEERQVHDKLMAAAEGILGFLEEDQTMGVSLSDEFKDEEGDVRLAEVTVAKYDKPNVVRGVLYRFPRAMIEIARVSEFGARKHEKPLGDTSYLDVPDAYVLYTEAETRHLLAEVIDGPWNEQDGNLLHKAQKAWNALADLEVYLDQRHQAEEAVGHEG